MKKILLTFISITFFLFSQDKMIALVGNKPIFEIDVMRKSKIENIPYSVSLNRIIEEKLLLHQAEKKGIEVKKEEVKNELNKFKKSFPSLNEFYNYLKKTGITLSQLEVEIENNLKIRKLVKNEIIDKIEISPVEISIELEKLKDEIYEYEFYFKWFDTKEDGQKFIENFNENSIKEMEYAKLKSSEMIDEILNEIKKIDKEKLTDLIQIKTKWMVIYLKNKNQIDVDKYEKYKEVREKIFMIKFSNLYRNYIEKLENSIPIEIF
ncbi:MAG: SurA N-terminal domain-containing protein [Candidatus Omnitrophica bacterium]|nr:SurA N-terminal domain-containing protein [Candidatus Omnitrophota bacterium]